MPARRKRVPKEQDYSTEKWRKWFERALKIDNIPMRVAKELKEYSELMGIDLLHMSQECYEKIRDKCTTLMESKLPLLEQVDTEKAHQTAQDSAENKVVETQSVGTTEREISEVFVKDVDTSSTFIPVEIRRRCWKIIKAPGRICGINKDKLFEWLAYRANITPQMAMEVISFYIKNRNLTLVYDSENCYYELRCCIARIAGTWPTIIDAQSKAMTKEEAFSKIQKTLSLLGFQVEKGEDFVLAKRKRTDGMSFGLFMSVKPTENIGLREYLKTKVAPIFHILDFDKRLRRLVDWWLKPPRLRPDELDVNVLTSFGWHSYLSEDIRQEALTLAAYGLNGTRVTRLLNFLKNTWPKNPNMPMEYSFNVKRDYDWFYENFGDNIRRYHLKKRFLLALQDECRKHIQEKRITLVNDVEEIARFILVVY
jgi:hypothetical protein